MAWIAETGRPVANQTPYVGPLKDIREMQAVELPLAADGRSVDAILVFVDFISKQPGQ